MEIISKVQEAHFGVGRGPGQQLQGMSIPVQQHAGHGQKPAFQLGFKKS